MPLLCRFGYLFGYVAFAAPFTRTFLPCLRICAPSATRTPHMRITADYCSWSFLWTRALTPRSCLYRVTHWRVGRCTHLRDGRGRRFAAHLAGRCSDARRTRSALQHYAHNVTHLLRFCVLRVARCLTRRLVGRLCRATPARRSDTTFTTRQRCAVAKDVAFALPARRAGRRGWTPFAVYALVRLDVGFTTARRSAGALTPVRPLPDGLPWLPSRRFATTRQRHHPKPPPRALRIRVSVPPLLVSRVAGFNATSLTLDAFSAFAYARWFTISPRF